MKLKIIKILSFFALFMVGLVLCVKEIREPDLWWQLRAGEWMLENQEVTKVDMFSYTHEGVEWINVKWLYEVIYASFSNVFGPETIVLFQMLSVSIILIFLLKWLQLLFVKKNYLVSASILAALLFLFIHAARINFRPEMTSYVLSLVYVYLFTLYRQEKSKTIGLLIPLQIFWNNMHEAYGVGLVMLSIFLIGSIVEWLINKKEIKNLAFPKWVLLVVFLAFVAIIFNPLGIQLLLHTTDIFGQLGTNKYTVELHGITDPFYWTPATIINNCIFIGGTLFMFFQFKDSSAEKLKKMIDQYGVVYLLLYFAFYYLSLKAARNSYFFAMIAFPIYTAIIQSIFMKLNKKEAIFYVVNLIIALGFYISIVTNLFYKTIDEKEHFGIQISSENNPIGVANFIKENHIEGKGFTDYFSSSYLLWALQPNFKTYIDLRDLDIFTQQFMDNVMKAHYNPGVELTDGSTLFEYMETFDDFNYVIMLNGDPFDNFNHYMHQNKNYQLVYVDGLNSMYLKVKEANQPLLAKYHAENEVFNAYAKNKTAQWTNVINHLFWPFYSKHVVSNETENQIKNFYFNKFRSSK